MQVNMQTKVKALKDFTSKIEDDPVELMTVVKDLSMSLIESSTSEPTGKPFSKMHAVFLHF